MRWFCGFLARDNNSSLAFAKPLKGRSIWEGENPLWACGPWRENELFSITEGSVRLAILGRYLIPNKTIVELFHNAIKSKDYSKLIKLSGNYNVIVQDETDTYIFADLASLRPVFYAVQNSFIVYSSHCVAIRQLINAEVDPYWLATWLMCPGMPGLVQSCSPFHNVQAVPPGHFLQISPGKLACKPYWTEPKEFKDISEAAEQLREQLLTAVERRVHSHGSITSDLSGGMDSTSLSLIAAKTLAAQGRKLHTITFGSTSATEREDINYAQHAASLYPNISSVVLESKEFPVAYSNLDEVPLTDEPAPVATTLGRFRYGMEVVRSKGSQLHLSGEGGDAVLLAPYSYLADLVRHAQLGTLIRHALGWAQVKSLSPVALISNAVKLGTTSYRRWLLQETQQLMTGQTPHQKIRKILGWSGPPGFASWYTQETIDLVIHQLEKYAAGAKPFSNQPGQHGALENIYVMGRSSRILQQIAEIHGVNLDVPYLDLLVIDACLCARTEERTNPFMFKPLLYRALRHDLPESVLTRTTKGDYTPDLFDGIRQNITTVNELLQTSRLADMGLIEIEKFRANVEQFSMGLHVGLWQFNNTLETEFWLRCVREDSHQFFSCQQ